MTKEERNVLLNYVHNTYLIEDPLDRFNAWSAMKEEFDKLKKEEQELYT